MQPASNQTDSPWQYKSGGGTTQAPLASADSPQAPAAQPSTPTEVSWTASEFVEHSKSLGWYLVLALITIVVLVIVFLWTKDMISIIAITVMAVLYGIMAARKPRIMEYRLDANGITIGSIMHPYTKFKSFAIVDEGAFSAISFMPFKRFMPPVGIYYAPQDQDRILAVLTKYLPLELQEPDMIDRFARRIRF